MVSWDEIFVTNITLIGFLPSRYKAMDFQIARMSKNSVTYFTLITFIPVVYHIVLHICTYAYITWRAILNHMLISCTFRLALCAYGCIVDDSVILWMGCAHPNCYTMCVATCTLWFTPLSLDGMYTSGLLYHVSPSSGDSLHIWPWFPVWPPWVIGDLWTPLTQVHVPTYNNVT